MRLFLHPGAIFIHWSRYDLVKALAQAAVDAYGVEEVRTWSFECWNELWGTYGRSLHSKALEQRNILRLMSVTGILPICLIVRAISWPQSLTCIYTE